MKHSTAVSRLKGQDDLLAFLGAARNLVWLAAVLGAAARATWLTGAALLACGFTHYFLHPLPWAPCLIVSVLPPAGAMLLAALGRRPTLENTAWLLDRRQRLPELLSAALVPVSREAARRSAVSAILVQRAAGTALARQSQLHRMIPWQAPRHALFLLSLGFGGFFLLLLPGADGKDGVPDPPPRSESAVQGAENRLARTLTRLRTQLQQHQIRGSEGSHAPSGKHAFPPVPTTDPEVRAGRDAPPDPALADATGPADAGSTDAAPQAGTIGKSAPGGADGTGAGDAPGAGSDGSPPGPDRFAVAELAKAYHHLPPKTPTGLHAGGSRRKGGLFKPMPVPVTSARHDGPGGQPSGSPGEPAAVAYHPPPSPSLKAYIASYFQALGASQ